MRESFKLNFVVKTTHVLIFLIQKNKILLEIGLAPDIKNTFKKLMMIPWTEKKSFDIKGVVF